ncbi:MAG TPA: phytanoyl-CoA dioxygenase family protein [Alphaproteobacteria bacterium]|nr:phytanoyl-CoA dioxygenase family protein [Alphaproteobacteria bacterium]
MTISQDTIEAFRADGAVLLKGVFCDWVETLRAGVERNLQEPGRYQRVYTPEGSGGRFVGDYCNWARIPEYRDFVFNSPAPEVARALMRSRTVRFFHEHILVKEPGTREITPWHHDQPYYCVDGKQNLSLWTPLDSVSKDVCVEFVAGSHAWGRWFRPRKFTGIAYDHKNDSLEDMPDISANRANYRLLSWDVEPGDAIAFHFLTVHGAPGNPSQSRRRAFASRWLGDDAVYAVRRGETSPPFPGLDERLKPGEALATEEFPLVIQ